MNVNYLKMMFFIMMKNEKLTSSFLYFEDHNGMTIKYAVSEMKYKILFLCIYSIYCKSLTDKRKDMTSLRHLTGFPRSKLAIK